MRRSFGKIFIGLFVLLLALMIGAFFILRDRFTIEFASTFWAAIIFLFVLIGVVTISLYLRKARKVYK